MKILVVCLIIGLIAGCTVKVKKELPDQSVSTLVRDSVVTDSLQLSKTVAVDTEVQNIPINEWVGKSFIVLPKQQMFLAHGYEIYLYATLDKVTTPIDSSIELKNHRIKSDKLGGHKLICATVDKLSPEFLVSFNDSILGKTLYCMTHKGAIKDMVMESDLIGAQKRWVGKKIYTKRGLISLIDKNGAYSSVKLDIRDSLMVQSVTIGVTPLPVKPLWIRVLSKKGEGFIPVRYSWNNMMSDLPKDGSPWDEEIFELDPMSFLWDQNTWDLINNHRVVKDMSDEQVKLSWGKPLSINKTSDNNVLQECWKYQAQSVCFVNRKVSEIKSE